jgi:DNA-binding transcriptional MocR family regulator
MPKDLIHAAVQQKGNHDFGSSSLAMHIAAEAMRDGTYKVQVERLRRTYTDKRDRSLAALDRHFGPLGGSGVGEWLSGGSGGRER